MSRPSIWRLKIDQLASLPCFFASIQNSSSGEIFEIDPVTDGAVVDFWSRAEAVSGAIAAWRSVAHNGDILMGRHDVDEVFAGVRSDDLVDRMNAIRAQIDAVDDRVRSDELDAEWDVCLREFAPSPRAQRPERSKGPIHVAVAADGRWSVVDNSGRLAA